MNHSPMSLRPFFHEFQVLLLRLTMGCEGAPLGAGTPRPATKLLAALAEDMWKS